MKQTVWRTVLREIQSSRGRFLAILMIVGLGVGFFSGLRVAETAMLETTRRYYRTHHFFDLHILSDLGYTSQEVDRMAGEPDVAAIEGANVVDVLCELGDGQEKVVRVHSLPDTVNGIKLVEGRLPREKGECVVDSGLLSGEGLGERIRFSSGSEEPLDQLAVKEYKVVGTVQSSYYIQRDRGNSSIGNGQVAGFVYIRPEAFCVDYFTDVFVCLNQDFPLYSKDYDTYIEERRQGWEEAAQQAAMDRYEDVMAEGRQELEDGRRELEAGRLEGEDKLTKAREELEEARKELEAGEKKLDEGKRQLEEARETVEARKRELEEAEAELAEQRARWEEARTALDKGKEEWNEGSRRLGAGRRELDKQAEELAAGREELTRQQGELEQGKSLLEEEEHKLLASERTLLGQKEELKRQKAELEAQLDALNQQEAALIDQYGAVPEEEAKALAAARDQVQAYLTQVAEGEAGVEAGLLRIEEGRGRIEVTRRQLEEGLARIVSASQAMAGYEVELAAGREELDRGDRELAQGWKELETGEKELEEGRVRLEEGQQALTDGRRQLEEAAAELLKNDKKLKAREKELAEGWDTYEGGLKEYEDKRVEFLDKIAKGEADLAEGERELAQVEKPEAYVLDRSTNVSYAMFENDSAAVAGIANVFPVFFFAVSVLVCVTTMSRMVEEQRSQIGLMKALGYSESSIVARYMVYSGLAALLGGMVGFLGGTWFFPKAIWTAYGISYRVEELVYILDWRLALISLMVALLCSVGSTWFTCRYELMEVAAQLMRPKAPKVGRRVLLEYVAPIWTRMKFLHKVSYRNVFRYKGRFAMMLIGIGGCCALLVTGFGVRDSIATVADRQFDEIQTYDMTIMLKKSLDEPTRQVIQELLGENLEAMTAVMEKTVEVQSGTGERKNLILIVPCREGELKQFVGLHTEQGREIAYPGEGEIVVGSGIAKLLRTEVGQNLTLPGEGNQVPLIVADKNENFLYNYGYVTSSTYQKAVGEDPEYKTLYVKLREGQDPYRLAAVLMKEKEIAAVTPSLDVRSRFGNMMESLNLIVILVIAAAGGLALIVLYNLTNINITERIREIATIKVLGFYSMETAAYVFRENFVLTAIGAGVGLGAGRLLHVFVMNSIPMEEVHFDIFIRPQSYLYSVLLTVLFTCLVNLAMMRRLEAIPMAESLKSVD